MAEPQTALDWIVQFGSLSVVAAVVGALSGGAVNWLLEGRKFQREIRIADLKDRMDKFYSPLLFHFENMKSWAVYMGAPKDSDEYAFSGQEMERKLEDMYQIMKSGMRIPSEPIKEKWFEWQRLATRAGDPLGFELRSGSKRPACPVGSGSFGSGPELRDLGWCGFLEAIWQSVIAPQRSSFVHANDG